MERVICLRDAFDRPTNEQKKKIVVTVVVKPPDVVRWAASSVSRHHPHLVGRSLNFFVLLRWSGWVRVDDHNGAAAGDGPADGGGRGDPPCLGGAL